MKRCGIEYLSSIEMAKRWGISDRRVRILCENGQVAGAERDGKLWKIPIDAAKPADGRGLRAAGIPLEMRGEFAAVEALKAKLSAMRPLTEGEREAVRKAFLVDYTYDSNAIEGNTLTPSETALVLEGVTISEKPLKDHLEALGHRDAFGYLEEFVASGAAMSEEFVRQLHALVLADKPQDRGVYRRLPVMISGARYTPPQPYLVGPQMEEWVRGVRETRLHPLVAAAEFHLRFEAIHPFIDGNGRTGRLVANFMLMREGYLPISIKYENRRAYYEAFRAYHEGQDARAMIAIFLRNERARMEEYVGVLGGESF